MARIDDYRPGRNVIAIWDHPYHNGVGCDICSPHPHPDQEFVDRHPILYFLIGAVSIVAFTVAMWLLLVIFVPQADAHGRSELGEWEERWVTHVAAAVEASQPLGVNVATLQPLFDEWWEMAERHPCYFLGENCPKPKVKKPVSVPASVEGWRSLVESYFPSSAVNTMLCLMYHESRGDPTALNEGSGATGLFQIMPFWQEKWPGDYTDANHNTMIARRVYDLQGFRAWAPYKRGLCR